MAFNSELSVKVSVDPRIDQTTFSRKLQSAVDVLHDKPNVELIPNSEKFGEAVKKVIGGPYPVDLNPDFTIDIKEKITKEIETVQKDSNKIKIVPDVENFGNDLGRAIKSQLRNVNTTLKRYVDRMATNITTLNQAATTLYSGPMFSNNNGVTKSMDTSTKSVKKTVVEVQKLDKLFATLGDDNGGYKSVEETKKLIREVSALVENVSKATNPNSDFVQDLNSNLQNTFDEASRLLDLKEKLAKSTNLKDDLNNAGIIVKSEKQAQNFYKLISDSENGLYKIKDILSSLDFENLDFSDAFNSFIEVSPELNKFVTLWNDFSSKNSGFKISGDVKSTLTYLSQYNDVFSGLKASDQFKILTEGISVLTQKALALNNILEKISILFEDKKALKTIDSNLVTKLKASEEKITDDELGSRIIEYYQDVVDNLKTNLSSEIEGLASELSKLKSPLSIALLEFISQDSNLIEKYSESAVKEIDKLGTVKEKITEEVQKPVNLQVQQQTPSNKVAKQDIESMSNRYAEIISEIVKQQDLLNKSKLTTLALEDRLKNKTKDHLATIKNQVEEYKKLFADFGLNDVLENLKSKNQTQESTDVSGTSLNNGTYVVTKVKFDVDPEVLQNDVNTLFKTINAPVGLVPAKDAIQNLKEKIEAGLKEVGVNATLTGSGTSEDEEKTDKKIPLQGKVELNEEDVAPPKSPVKIPGHVTLTKSDVTVPEEPVDILAKTNIVENDENKPTTEATATVKTENVTVVGDAVTVPTKSVLETKDVTPPIDPVDIKGKVTLEVNDIKVPDKIDLNGNLVIKNATKEIRDATKKANGTNKTKNNASNRDFDRKSKELLTSLASLTKGLAKTENSMKKHANGINPEAYDEDSLYSARIQRRIRTTKTKLTKLYKGHGGRKAWENDPIYTSAVEDAEHISHGYDASLKDDQLKQETKEFAAAEQNYLSALRERPKLYKEISDAQKKYGDNSEYVKSAQKKLTETISTIKGFESSVSSDYLNQMPARKKIFEENMSNLRKQRDDVVKKNTQIADKQQIVDNKERIKSENEFLDALAKEPNLWKKIEEARKKFGDNSPEVARAKNEQDKNNSIIQNFKNGYKGSLSDIDGYDKQIKENNLNYGVYSAEIARKAQEEAQAQHDANQKSFAKARENKAKQQANSTKVTKAQQDQWLKNAEGIINEAKKKYIVAFKEVQESQKKLLQTNDQQLQADLNQRISDLRKSMKSNGDIINSYGHTPLTSELAQNAFSEIQALRTSTRNKASDNAALQNERDIIDDIVSSCKELQGLYKNRQQLFKPEDATELANVDQRIQNIEQHVQDLIDTSENAGISILNSSDVNDALNSYSNAVGKSNTKFSNSKLNYTIDTAKGSYIENFKKKRENEDYLSRIDQNNPKAAQMEKQYKQWIQENEAAIQQAAQTLNSCHAAANDAWKEIQEVVNSSNIKDTEAANKAADAALKKNEANAKKAAADAKKQETEDTQFFSQLNQAVNAKLRTYKAFLEAEREDPTKKSKNYIAAEGNFNDADINFSVAVQNAINSGLNTDSRFDNAMNRHNRNMDAVGEASDKRAKAEAEAVKVTEEDIVAIQKLEDTLDGVKNRIRNAGGVNTDEYNNAVTAQSKVQELRSRLEAELQKPGSDKNAIAVQWASENDINNVKSLDEVVQRLTNDVSHLNSEGGKISADKSLERSTYKAKTELANLKSQLNDYLKKSPGVESGMAEEVQALQRALGDTNAWQNIGQLKQNFAELRAKAKELDLETESLVDKFKNLFGQHFSTMITMAALHQMQNALGLIYQNVVQIDTAMSELRKVSNMTASEMEKYMDRAADSAQQLGVTISDFISSTADWKRLGYSDEDAENMATYSTLLKNVGDEIDDVNTSSSYLISTLQGFGLLAKDAEDVVNQIDSVANTQPITANSIGEILQRSASAMAAANNNLSETISLGTAAYSVLQNAESTGTMLKSLSMYLRASKSELEAAGESAEGCANSVSELRNELKALTGVDIMVDSKNFKSTYQIMKELSEVWGSLSDVTQANVTEMIGGKVYPYVQQCA